MIVTVPDVTAVTSPPEVTVAPAERACHVAAADTFFVAPSEKVANAVSWTVWPMLMKSVGPFTATDDTTVGAVVDAGIAEEPQPAAIGAISKRTIPSRILIRSPIEP
jgi:hypothetical protein